MIIDILAGNFVKLRCANQADAEFTLAIRQDPEITKILPPIHNTLEQQREWLLKQIVAEDSCFLIIENLQGKALGTLSFYNIDWENRVCEMGRLCSYGTPVENIEANVLLTDYLFMELKFVKLTGQVQLANIHVKSYNERFGYEYIRNAYMEWGGEHALYELYPDKYYAKRKKIMLLLDSVKMKGL